MQKDIQPKYYQATVRCNCGNTFTCGSTAPEIRVEVCSKCHPFYTGTQKAMAARGRIDSLIVSMVSTRSSLRAKGGLFYKVSFLPCSGELRMLAFAEPAMKMISWTGFLL